MIVVLALALTGAAYAIHVATFCDPRHPECMKIGPAETHAAEAHGETHGAAPAGAAEHTQHAPAPAGKGH
jgi:hypothetical protein